MKRLGIVILNYYTWELTKKCIECIDKNSVLYEAIVVVDNHSGNDSVRQLKNCFLNHSKVHILRTGSNYGFAKANNIGMKYLKERFNTNFILLLNNDAFILSKEYVPDLLSCYKKGVGIIGSNIVLENEYRQKSEFENLTLLGILFENLKRAFELRNLYFPFKKQWGGDRKTERIHGCMILVCPDYLKAYGILWPHNFFYSEERILSVLLEKVGLRLKVSNGEIYHKEHQSNDLFYSNKSIIRKKIEQASLWQLLLIKCLPYKVIKMLMGE